MTEYDPNANSDRRKKFYLRREIDLSGVGSIIIATVTILSVLVGLYWSVMAAVSSGQTSSQTQIEVLRTAINALDTQNKLLQQQINGDERTNEATRQQLQQYIRDTSDWEKGFSAEIRNALSQITQALSDLRTNIAVDGRNGKR